jgi:dolichol-phosphate mannosyltransferase
VLVSVVIPAHDEAGHIAGTLRELAAALREAGIRHEIVVVDDHSGDATRRLVGDLAREIPGLRLVANPRSNGFGLAVRAGLEAASGDAVAVYMADASDSPQDLVRFVHVMQKRGVDCVFGSRFARGGRVVDYPRPKLVLNRLGNAGIRVLFGLRYDDVTNAFKLYRREVIEGLEPLLSHHFNLTVELPLKAIVRGYSYAVVPNTWTNRKEGTSKFRIQEMGSRYAFIILYCFLEKWLSRGDYRRPSRARATAAPTLGRVGDGR